MPAINLLPKGGGGDGPFVLYKTATNDTYETSTSFKYNLATTKIQEDSFHLSASYYNSTRGQSKIVFQAMKNCKLTAKKSSSSVLGEFDLVKGHLYTAEVYRYSSSTSSSNYARIHDDTANSYLLNNNGSNFAETLIGEYS